MIIKHRENPLTLQKLDALLRRLPQTHLKMLELREDFAKRSAGNSGEHSLEDPLSFLSEDEFFLQHDLRLPHGAYYFQIDLLVISPTFLLIIEMKNMTG